MLTYKNNRDEISSLHSKLRSKHGSATHCSSEICKGISTKYEWALKTDRDYTDNPDDYLQLCRSCHRKYDLTPAKKQKAVENLWWKKGRTNPSEANLFKKGEMPPTGKLFAKGHTPWNKKK